MDNHVLEMHKRVGNDFKVDPETTYYLHVEPDIHGDLATLTMYHRLCDSDSNRYIDEIDFAMHHNLDSVVETCSIIRSVVSKLVCILSRWCTAVLAEKLKALGITAVVSNEYIASVISTIIEEEKLKMERKMSEKKKTRIYRGKGIFDILKDLPQKPFIKNIFIFPQSFGCKEFEKEIKGFEDMALNSFMLSKMGADLHEGFEALDLSERIKILNSDKNIRGFGLMIYFPKCCNFKMDDSNTVVKWDVNYDDCDMIFNLEGKLTVKEYMESDDTTYLIKSSSRNFFKRELEKYVKENDIDCPSTPEFIEDLRDSRWDNKD